MYFDLKNHLSLKMDLAVKYMTQALLWALGLVPTNYACHLKAEFEPGKVQYSIPKFFDRLFLIRVY